jgi:hypothetical protein
MANNQENRGPFRNTGPVRDSLALDLMEAARHQQAHGRNRALLTLITAQLASQQLETWSITPPREPLEQIASYLDNRDTHNPNAGASSAAARSAAGNGSTAHQPAANAPNARLSTPTDTTRSPTRVVERRWLRTGRHLPASRP